MCRLEKNGIFELNYCKPHCYTPYIQNTQKIQSTIKFSDIFWDISYNRKLKYLLYIKLTYEKDDLYDKTFLETYYYDTYGVGNYFSMLPHIIPQ